MTDIMIDIETKGIGIDAAVLSIGAVKFERTDRGVVKTGTGMFYELPDLLEQEIMGRTTDKLTMSWWQSQSPEVYKAAFTDDGRKPVETVLLNLFNFCNGATAIWAQGPQFDIAILEHMYESKDLAKPWKYSQIRDSRTLFDVLGDYRDKNNTNLHNALEDALVQTYAVQECFHHLGEKATLWNLTNNTSG